MILSEEEALRILILISYYFNHEGFSITDRPSAEGLGEVQLARRIGKEFSNLQSHVEMVLRGE